MSLDNLCHGLAFQGLLGHNGLSAIYINEAQKKLSNLENWRAKNATWGRVYVSFNY